MLKWERVGLIFVFFIPALWQVQKLKPTLFHFSMGWLWVDFMKALLDLDRMQARIRAYAETQEMAKELTRGAGRVLCEIFLRGEIARGQVHRFIGASARTAQKLTGELLARRLVVVVRVVCESTTVGVAAQTVSAARIAIRILRENIVGH